MFGIETKSNILFGMSVKSHELFGIGRIFCANTERSMTGGPLDFLISPVGQKSFENHEETVCFELETVQAAAGVLFSDFARARAGWVWCRCHKARYLFVRMPMITQTFKPNADRYRTFCAQAER